MKNTSIRPTTHHDIPALQIVLDKTGLFPSEMLPEMLEPFLAKQGAAFWLTCHLESVPVGFCYVAPEAITDRTWNMLALAVRPDLHGRRLGSVLVQAAEMHLQEQGQRLLLVETSSGDDFVLTRQFYSKNGYREDARIRDFWSAGDDKVVFRKAL